MLLFLSILFLFDHQITRHKYSALSYSNLLSDAFKGIIDISLTSIVYLSNHYSRSFYLLLCSNSGRRLNLFSFLNDRQPLRNSLVPNLNRLHHHIKSFFPNSDLQNTWKHELLLPWLINNWLHRTDYN